MDTGDVGDMGDMGDMGNVGDTVVEPPRIPERPLAACMERSPIRIAAT